MFVNYSQYRTPFFEIVIGDPAFKRKVKLPDHILRLVEKIEINEAFAFQDIEKGSTTAVITMVEGSREPASNNPLSGTEGLYKMVSPSGKTDLAISGSITNRTGSIVDLRFSGNSGITFLTEKEKKEGKVDSTAQKNVDGKFVTREHKGEDKSPQFLFQYLNKVKITWGYITDKGRIEKSLILSIIAVETTFSDNGPNIINIQCADYNTIADRFAPPESKSFGVYKNTKNGVLMMSDKPTNELVKDFAKNAGMAAIVSDNLFADKLDKNKTKIWMSGVSANQFLTKLALDSGCYYKMIPDPYNDGVGTIIFIKKDDFEARLIPLNINKDLFTYKAQGSLIKKVTVNADFSNNQGFTSYSTNDKGEKTGAQTDQGVSEVLFDKDQPLDSAVTKDPYMKKIIDSHLDGKYTGNVEIHPNQNQGFHNDRADLIASNQNRTISIVVDMIGHPKLTCGVVEINGVGVRYSGRYRVLRVQHILDSNGYSSQISGLAASLPNGGVKLPEATKGQDKKEDNKVNVNLFAKRDELDKFQGTV